MRDGERADSTHARTLSALPVIGGRRAEGRRLPAVVRALRPLQWTKNGVIGAAVVFGHRLGDPESLARTILAIVVFCALSSGVYLVNDVRDAASDRLHPLKRRRPIAAGELRPTTALAVAGGLVLAAAVGGWLVRPAFLIVAAAYVVLMVGYTLGLKRLVILDVFAIAAGFVLRAAAGAVAIDVAISPWLLVCTMLLALFLGFGKRRNELSTLAADAAAHRANLDSYSIPLLDQLIGITASATVMAYAFYTFDAAAVPASHAMMLTIPIVTYAVFRYLYLVQGRGLGGSPEALLFADRSLLASIVVWGLASIGILYLLG
ncbi:MAG: decaprenyl-phosphate phosphoribosyltransferase [Chloroflexota bacterium]|nr:decaprenyl-phosphate phosphoribosyltransferase [Chloroflexota bacterium]